MSLFTLDGRTLEEFGLIAQPGHQHAMLPSTLERRMNISGMHGSYDFGASLTERTFSFPLVFANEINRFDLQQKIRTFSAFLLDGFGYPRDIKLIFNYEPSVYYTVRYSGGLVPERIFALGYFNLAMMASDPFARSITGTDGLILDSDIVLDSDIRLHDEFSYAINRTIAVEINNWGSINAWPEIIVTGSLQTLTIVANGRTFSYTSSITNENLIINGEQMTVEKGAENALYYMSGHFIFMLPGINQVTIGGTGLNCSVSFNFQPKYI